MITINLINSEVKGQEVRRGGGGGFNHFLPLKWLPYCRGPTTNIIATDYGDAVRFLLCVAIMSLVSSFTNNLRN